MSLEIDMKKIEEGVIEMCKIAINWAEANLNHEVRDYKRVCDRRENRIKNIMPQWDYKLRVIGQNSYKDKTESIKSHIKQDVRVKYENMLYKLIESKIKEIKRYKPKSLEGAAQ